MGQEVSTPKRTGQSSKNWVQTDEKGLDPKRQVPASMKSSSPSLSASTFSRLPFYTIIGSGRLARHLRHYFQLQGLTYSVWSRAEFERGECLSFLEACAESTHILWAISDSALQAEIQKAGRELKEKKIHVHFSGALVIPEARSAHPLMSFPSDGLWDLERYRRIPFVIEQDGPEFHSLLPGLPNPFFKIASRLKPLYHAYCVVAGNLSALLWQSVIQRFESKLGLQREILFPYLDQITENLKLSAETAVTGPLIRQDIATIEKNKAALESDSLLQVYSFFHEWLKANRGSLL
jgi:predicted short-subunit dehydrogenase-like oxidoreductase (DUF2520 family)